MRGRITGRRVGRLRRSVRASSTTVPFTVMDQQGFMGNKVVQVQRGITPFASEFICSFRYFERISLQNSNSVNTASTYSFRLNSLFDPNYTGTGHQPYQYDQLTGIYNNYIVERTHFKITFRNSDAAGSYNGIFVGASVFADTNVADSASGKTLSEIKEKAVTQIRPVTTQLNRENFITMQSKIDMPRMLGMSRVSYYGDLADHGAVYNANPVRTVWLELCIVDPDANSGSDMNADVELTFFAKLWGYKGPAQS